MDESSQSTAASIHDDEKVSKLSRRDLLVPAAAALAFTIVPRHVLGQSAAGPAPSDKLNIAGVGVGDMGGTYIDAMNSENIVALADCDLEYAAETFGDYPKAKIYQDYRVMLEKEKGIDAVVIGTPDHTHAYVSMDAIQLGKHVYVAKPMCHTVYETRRVTKAARDARIVTQVSTQGGFSEAAQSTAEILRSGLIGHVREIHISTDSPIWPQGIPRPTGNFAMPKKMDWNLWLGPAPARPYNPLYHPFNWRGFRDFGTGALGDMSPHLWHVFWNALELTYPTRISASVALQSEILHGASAAAVEGPEQVKSKKTKYTDTYPIAQILTFEFPQRGNLPPLRIVWYDGNLLPPRPLGYDPNLRSPAQYYVGDKGVLIPGGGDGGGRAAAPANAAAGRGQAAAASAPAVRRAAGGNGTGIARGGSVPAARGAAPTKPFILLVDGKETDFTPPPKTLPRTIGHYKELISAVKGGPPTNCSFNYSCLYNETALLGLIAERLGADLIYDAARMFTNNAEANQFLNPPSRAGWSL